MTAMSAAMHVGYAKITRIRPGAASDLQSERPRGQAENAARVLEDFRQGWMDKLIGRAEEYEIVD
jgi:hypothetical protein